MNTLYYGDNLNILREYIKDESVDLIYLDPPFNSNRNYNVLFKNEAGTESESQITAFEDTWHWNLQAEQTYNELINQPDQVGRMIESFRQFIGQNQMMAYLVMMAVRLKELHRVLKPTGSLYLHCDPTASHYLKILLDTIFGAENFRNEISWKRADAHNDAKKQFGILKDVIFFYGKTKNNFFKPQHTAFPEQTLRDWYLYLEFPDGTVRRMTKTERETQEIPQGARRFNTDNTASPNPRPNLMYSYKGYPHPAKGWRYELETMKRLDAEGLLLFPSDPKGRIMRKRYLDEQKGPVLGDVWTDISQVRAATAEILGYPTQKPVALLERIISASSNEGDVVLDPFCGCGTSIVAAQKLNRQWIGIDITHLSVGLMKLRLKDTFGLTPERSKGHTIAQQKAWAKKVEAMSDEEFVEMGEWLEGDPNKHVFKVVGQPEDLEGAKELAEKDKYGFQWWILPLIGAKAFGSEAGKKEGKKGADGGIDGMIVFTDDNSGKAKKVIVSVKGGGITLDQIRSFADVIRTNSAAIGVFLTLVPPTKKMIERAVAEGFYHSPGWNKDYPRIQILTVEEVLAGKQPELPPNIDTFKKAGKLSATPDDQASLFGG